MNRSSITSPQAMTQVLRRLHFRIGLFVAPFLLIAALTGTLYALTPQLENLIYHDALYTDSQGTPLPLADQLRSAQRHLGQVLPISAVRPAPHAGDTTRVMFHQHGDSPSLNRAVFIDPVTGNVQGDMPVYGTSGVLPLRTWLDQLHRALLLGDVGRLYSELAASWLWVAALGGAYLWWRRRHSVRGALRLVDAGVVHATAGRCGHGGGRRRTCRPSHDHGHADGHA